MRQKVPIDEVVEAYGHSSAALQKAASRTTGDVLAFLDARDPVPASWSEALISPLLNGAGIAAGPAPDADLDGCNGFMPIASLTNLAVWRRAFHAVGGLDPGMAGAAAADLSFRLQLEGYELVAVPEAALRLDRSPARPWRSSFASPLLWCKYREFAFVAPPLPSSPVKLVSAAAGWGVILAGWRRPPAPLQPSSSTQALTARPVPASPALILSGDSSSTLRRVGRALRRQSDLIAGPPISTSHLARGWHDPPPWSLRLALELRRRGWRIPPYRAARRLETLRPATLGEALLALHGVGAWLAQRRGYVLLLHGQLDDLRSKLPPAPLEEVVSGGRWSAGRAARHILSRLATEPSTSLLG